ncbi:hypothetical protein [Heyndrickxia sporothermodurans]
MSNFLVLEETEEYSHLSQSNETRQRGTFPFKTPIIIRRSGKRTLSA